MRRCSDRATSTCLCEASWLCSAQKKPRFQRRTIRTFRLECCLTNCETCRDTPKLPPSVAASEMPSKRLTRKSALLWVSKDFVFAASQTTAPLIPTGKTFCAARKKKADFASLCRGCAASELERVLVLKERQLLREKVGRLLDAKDEHAWQALAQKTA